HAPQTLREFRDVRIQLLTQPGRQKGEPFQKALYIRVLGFRGEKRRQAGLTLGKFFSQLPQGAHFFQKIILIIHTALRYILDTDFMEALRRTLARLPEAKSRLGLGLRWADTWVCPYTTIS